MKFAIAAAAVLALSTLGVSPRSLEEVRFVPAEETSIEKVFARIAEMESENISNHGTSTSSSTSEAKLLVIDEYASVEDGRVLRLERSFDELSWGNESTMDFDGNSREMSTTGTCEVEGATVVFEWDEDDEECRASSDDVDDDLLEGLEFDLDFTALLPDGEVVEDDEWELDPEAFMLLINPWEGLDWEWENQDGQTFGGGDRVEPEREESTDGELGATFAGLREVDGITVAVITIEGEVEVESTIDTTHEFEQGSARSHSEELRSYLFEGEALWILAEGRLHTLELTAEMSSSGTTESSHTFGDQEFESVSDNESEGTVSFTVSCAAAE